MNTPKRLLLIDDDESLLKVTAHQLRQFGYEVIAKGSGEDGLATFKETPFAVAVTDLQLPGVSGIEVLQEIRRHDRDCVVIIITAYGTIEDAVKACELGADDYLTKPFSREQLRFVLEKALRLRRLQSENRYLRSELGRQFDFGNIIAKSAAMENVLKMAARIAESEATVLISGESGTGKELLARAIHFNSPRRDQPLITVNCPSIPENLLESELFGHVKGAFTGAVKDREGKFEQAEGGTIFLDEIGDLKPELQAKLLRVLQEKEIERVGGSKPIKVDVRVIAATNRDLDAAMREGNFREDLYYRLMVVPITLPPLREHAEDIPFLVDHFLQKHGSGRPLRFTPETLERLRHYDWPGNIRELENAVARAIILSSGDELKIDILSISPAKVHATVEGHTLLIPPDGLSLDELEKQAIALALRLNNSNQTQAAKFLRVPRHILLYRMKKLGIRA
ncbi:sigma-54 dependent transcriptional regulator [candidate division KSB1 bacterium]|nr:sigma-54 dependent transcriptional regulator [candidate division KSB1 bacterium]